MKIQLRPTNYIEINHIIHDCLYGFRHSKNTSDSLFDITKFVSHQYGCKNLVLIMFLNLAKAFNSMDKEKLIDKLYMVAVRNNSLNWIQSNFFKRSQKVSINGTESDLLEVVQDSTYSRATAFLYLY